jgi:putative YphP/YqiW family bacilliredoxin
VAEVDAALGDQRGTTLVFVNSVCGCAAGNARPALRVALGHAARPQEVVTVFAGQDVEATARARQYFSAYAPSSPSMALLRDGEVVHFIHRHQIEGRSPQAIAGDLTAAFDRHFAATV